MADQDFERRLKEAHSVITEIAQNGASREEADIVARQKYGVTLDDVIKYDDSQRGVEIWGVPVPRGVGAAVVGYGQGLTSNWGDELRGRIKQGAAYLTGEDPQAAYDREVADTRSMESSLRDTNPVPYYAGQVGGGVNQAIVVPGATTSKALPLGSAMLRGAGTGAVQGAIAGAGAADGDLADRGIGGITGLVVGGVTGGALPIVARGAEKVYDAGKSFLQDLIQPKINLAPAAVQGADAVQAAVAPTQPITVGASDRSSALDYIAKSMERDQIDSRGASVALDTMGPEGRLADLGPNLRDAAGAVISQPGTGKSIAVSALEGRQAGQQQRLADAAKSKLGATGDWYRAADELVSKQASEASPLYDQAFANASPVDTSNVIAALQGRAATAKGNIKTALNKILGYLGDEVDTPEGKVFQPDTSLQGLHEAKLAIDDMLDAAKKDSSMGRVVKREIMQVKAALLEAMDASNPVYKEARDKFAGNAAALDALDAGRQFLKEDAEITGGEIANMTSSEKTAFVEGVYRSIRDIIESNPADRSVVNKLRGTGFIKKLAAAFPSTDALNQFLQTVENEARFAGTRAATMGNSATAQRLSSAVDMNGSLSQAAENVMTGNTPGLMRQAWQWLQSDAAPSEKQRAVLADLLLRQGPDAIKKLLPDIDRRRLAQALMATSGSAARSAAGQQAAGGAVRAQGQGRPAP